MVKEKSWTEFRDTGLVVFINQLLHIFGWAIVFEMNDNGDINRVFPARVKFRGFSQDITLWLKSQEGNLFEEVMGGE